MELKDIQAAVAEALKPVTDRLDKIEKGGTTATAAAAHAGADNNITNIVTAAVQAAVKPFADELGTMKKNTLQAQARSAIQPHIERGAIAPQDTKTIEFFTASYQADAAGTEAVMGKLPGRKNGRVVTATAGSAAAADAAAQANLDPEAQFMAQAREFGTKLGLKTDVECLTAFASNAEGRDLYNQFRQTYTANARN